MKTPIKYPNCGSKSIAEILYGLLHIDEELQQELDEEKITLGGCCVIDNDPQFQCNDCNAQIFEGGNLK